MRRPFIAGNWKMYKTLAPARELVNGIRDGFPKIAGATGVDVLICPPATLLFPMAKAIAGSAILMGAQNCHEAAEGAFTGELSVAMLTDTGCTHVIVGHSERRQLFAETGERLAKKVRAVVGAGLTAIYCVGETLSEREAGRTGEVVGRQFEECVAKDVPPDRLLLAYEPVWAIGTGKTATPGQAQEVHAMLRGRLAGVYEADVAGSIRILYGGSVKPANSGELLSQPDIDGALVGGACLAAVDFLAIIAAAAARVR